MNEHDPAKEERFFGLSFGILFPIKYIPEYMLGFMLLPPICWMLFSDFG